MPRSFVHYFTFVVFHLYFLIFNFCLYFLLCPSTYLYLPFCFYYTQQPAVSRQSILLILLLRKVEYLCVPAKQILFKLLFLRSLALISTSSIFFFHTFLVCFACPQTRSSLSVTEIVSIAFTMGNINLTYIYMCIPNVYILYNNVLAAVFKKKTPP